MRKFLSRHLDKIVIGFCILAVALLTVDQTVTHLVFVPKHKPPAEKTPKKHHKGVDDSNGHAPSSLPGPPSGGLTKSPGNSTAPPETPPKPAEPPPNISSPQPLPEVTKPVCDLTGALNLPLCK